MDYKQFEGHTVGTNDFLVRNLREYANDLRVVNGILPKQDIVRAADLIESLKLDLQKHKEWREETMKWIRENFADMADECLALVNGKPFESMKSKYEKQKELNAELVKTVENALKVHWLSYGDEGKLRSLIKKSSEI